MATNDAETREAIAKLLWERFAPEHEVDWPPTHAAEYRSVADDLADFLSRHPRPSEPLYRFLNEGDVIQATDEFVRDDGQSWGYPEGWEIGMTYPSKIFKSARRLVEVESAPTDSTR